MKAKVRPNTRLHKGLHTKDPLADDLANWIEIHADHLASAKCVWWLNFHATDVAEVLLPETAAYDTVQASYLEARLSRCDITLLEQGMGDLAKRLIEAYRTNGEWTDSEGIDGQVVGNLIARLREYGVFDDEADPELDDAIYQDLTHRELQTVGTE